MDIKEIKEKLTMSDVLRHYGLKPDKYMRLHCPFHDDGTPSMQVYYKTHTAYCFSTDCRTNGKSLDVIDFVMYKENTGKAEAVAKCRELINPSEKKIVRESRERFLNRIFTYFKNGVHGSQPAKEYLALRHLDHKEIDIGYNAAQFHHGKRKDDNLIRRCLEHGLLYDKGLTGRTGEKAYGVFGRMCIAFALRNKENDVVSLYFRSILNNKEDRHFYLKNRQGLYPHYPKAETEKLILTESIIDAATLLQQSDIVKEYGILACYGTNGLSEEHTGALKELKNLKEIIFFFDGDEAGRKAVVKYGGVLKEIIPHLKITRVHTPEKEDVNSLAQSHEKAVFKHLLENRTALSRESSASIQKEEKENAEEVSEALNRDANNPYHITYKGTAAEYQIKGGIKPQPDSLKISLRIIEKETGRDYRTKLDLYEYKQVHATARQAAEQLGIRSDEAEHDLMRLTELAEQYRDKHLQQSQTIKPRIYVGEAAAAECIAFLSRPQLISRLNELIGKAGVTGEHDNRIFLFVIASSYKMKDTLHALVQGSSGSGKTHLILKISGFMPPEDVVTLTRVTESSFYNYGEYELQHMLLCFEDLDGMKEEALLALRELMSREMLTSSTSIKDEQGNIRAAVKTVRGPIASMSATTKGEIYEDNMSRSFIIAVDESKEQTQKIIQYQNQKAAGLIDEKKEKDIKLFLQNCIRLLKPYDVVNPYAGKIRLPEEAHKIRRLNELYQAFVRQITVLNQYQRKKDPQGRLITEKEDLKTACDIMFESIFLKVDELDGSLRQYFEQVKTYAAARGKDYEFTRLELRQQLKTSKTLQHNYLSKLIHLEYIRQSGGYANRGYHYKIVHWDNMKALRTKIKDGLALQLQNL